ncbi:hypothetical protein Dimus_012950 [Dionaea muscipula]
MLHFFVIKNLLPRFRKRNTTIFMDLTYLEYLTAVLPINLPRLMIRHMSYVISVPQHELPYGEWLIRVFEDFGVPLNDKEGEEQKRTDFYVETFFNTSQLKREQGVWWLGIRANRRRNDEVNEEEGQNQEEKFDWVQVEEEAQVHREPIEKDAEICDSGSGEKFYDAEDVERPADEEVITPIMEVPALEVPVALVDQSIQSKGKKVTTGVDPSGSSACREFYKNLVVEITSKKEVASSSVHGVEIELDDITLATILGIPGNLGLCDYIKDVWEEGKRRDDEVNEEEVANEEINEGQNQEENFDWVQVEEEAPVHGEPIEKDAEICDSGSGEKFYDAEDVERPADEEVTTPIMDVPALEVPVALVDQSIQSKGKKVTTRVDPSGPLGSLPDFDIIHLQAEFARAPQANTNFQELYRQLKSNPTTSPKPSEQTRQPLDLFEHHLLMSKISYS